MKTTLGLLLTLGAACAQQRCASPQLNPGLHSKVGVFACPVDKSAIFLGRVEGDGREGGDG